MEDKLAREFARSIYKWLKQDGQLQAVMSRQRRIREQKSFLHFYYLRGFMTRAELNDTLRELRETEIRLKVIFTSRIVKLWKDRR